MRGKGIIDRVSNGALSAKHNRALPGEKHQIRVRIARNNQPLSYVGKTAQAHDLRYSLANVDADVRTADKRMVTSLTKAKLQKLDSNFKY